MDNAENNVLDAEIQQYSGNIKSEFIAKALKMYQKYKSDKAELNKRVVANNKWYKSNYSQTINPKSNETEPATSFIFSAIENKYADAIDNFPVPNLLEREPSDAQTAKILSKIIPVQLDMSGYKRVYKDNWRRKLKYGTAIYGVFYNDEKEDIDVRAIDILNIYCDMHIKDVQDSQFLFIVTAVDNDVLSMQFISTGVYFCFAFFNRHVFVLKVLYYKLRKVFVISDYLLKLFADHVHGSMFFSFLLCLNL